MLVRVERVAWQQAFTRFYGSRLNSKNMGFPTAVSCVFVKWVRLGDDPAILCTSKLKKRFITSAVFLVASRHLFI